LLFFSVGVVAAWPHRVLLLDFLLLLLLLLILLLLDLLIFLILFFAATAGSVPGASVPVAGSRCWPGAKWEDGPDRGSNSHWDSHWDSRSGWRWYLD